MAVMIYVENTVADRQEIDGETAQLVLHIDGS